MPLLSAEPCVFPEGLFADCDPPGLPELGPWLVLHTRPRQEKSLARELFGKRIPFYLPVAPRRYSQRGRVMTSHLPLFTGYLFLLADPEQRMAALSTQRVARCLPVADQPRLWADLRQVHRLIDSGLPLTPEEALEPGQRVEIVSGPLTGFRGEVVRSASGDRFVVKVDFIHRGASVLCEGMSLRPLAVTA
jgi:transcriptional antiterminator RfaH